MPKPLGHEFVRSTVGENIAMNFASGAQQPFLRILDEIKKCYLATDGLGQQVLIKGFSSEGHDSANTDYAGHWNERAGGLKDFTVLLEHAHEYNARVGIHINASEVYPEAHRYKPEILQRDANGNPKPGWVWLDHAHMIDKRKDILSGDLFAALDQMRQDLPKLDFLYVDTYWENGWPAWKTARKINSLGLPMYTEGAGALDPWTSWAHWREIKFTVMRFLWYSDRDLFDNDPLLRGGRADDDGFLGWQNQHNFTSFIRSTFSRQLPAKFLKHFELLRWEPNKEAIFSDGVKVAKNGDAVTVTQDGCTVMTWTGGGANSRLFVPWEPKSAARIYVWDEAGTPQSWELPSAWQNLSEVFLYKLADLGRTEETKLPVVNGRVTLAAAKSTPYVLYPKPAPSQPPLLWGEGSLVKDPGFDIRAFSAWSRGPASADVSHIKVESDRRGNPRLVISGNDGAAGEVCQVMTGLESGQTYAASVWVQCKGTRTASINVLPLDAPNARPSSNYVSRTNVRHSAPNDPRTGSNYQRLKVLFELPPNSTSALLTLKADSGSPATTAEFDDVRVVPAARPSPEAARHFFYEDFENVDQGYGPFTCCPGERTHLSEANPPFTDDTINGRFSLKSRDNGRVLRTLPCTLRLKPRTQYHLACETIGNGRLTAESKGKTVLELKFPGTRGKISGDFATLDDTESFLSLFRDGGDSVVIDDLALDELGPAPAIQTP
jgi:endo-alpha-N-acetylgalactosaminidase